MKASPHNPEIANADGSGIAGPLNDTSENSAKFAFPYEVLTENENLSGLKTVEEREKTSAVDAEFSEAEKLSVCNTDPPRLSPEKIVTVKFRIPLSAALPTN